MAQGPATIGQWTESTLAKYIRESIERLAPDHLTAITIDDLIVSTGLDVKGAVDFHRKLVTVGTAGAPSFQNGWVNYGAGYAPAAYWKDENGIVTIEGMIKNGTLSVAAFVLPPGYRPDQTRIFATFSNTSAGVNTIGLVQVQSGGIVQPLPPSGASNNAYGLDGIRFRTGKT